MSNTYNINMCLSRNNILENVARISQYFPKMYVSFEGFWRITQIVFIAGFLKLIKCD